MKNARTILMAAGLFAGLYSLTIQSAKADDSPLQCKIEKQPLGTLFIYSYVICSFTKDNSNLQNVSLNRGKCDPLDLNQYELGKTYGFGDSIKVSYAVFDSDSNTQAGCELIEFSFTVNGTPWTWKVNN